MLVLLLKINLGSWLKKIDNINKPKVDPENLPYSHHSKTVLLVLGAFLQDVSHKPMIDKWLLSQLSRKFYYQMQS